MGAFARGRRDELVIATKYTAITRPGDVNAWGNHRKSLRQALSASLERLQTDYVDILWVHAWDGITPPEEIMRALDDEVRAGRVLYIGVSNAPAWLIARANTMAELRGWASFIGLQVEYSLVTRTCEHELLPMSRHMGLRMVAWSPLGGGVLAGGYANPSQVTGTRFGYDEVPPHRLAIAARVVEIANELRQPPAAVSLAWLRRRPVPVIPILGARTAGQLRDNLTGVDLPLSDDVRRRLDEVSAPPPIMPGEFTDTAAAARFFHKGARDQVVERGDVR